jgi:hypothetical protein
MLPHNMCFPPIPASMLAGIALHRPGFVQPARIGIRRRIGYHSHPPSMAFSSPSVPKLNFFQQNGSPSLNQKINAGPTTTSTGSDILFRQPVRLPEWSSCFKAAGLQPEWIKAMENQPAVQLVGEAELADHRHQGMQSGGGAIANHAVMKQGQDNQPEHDRWNEPGAHEDRSVMSPVQAAHDPFNHKASPGSMICPPEPSDSTSARSFSSIDAYLRTVHKVNCTAYKHQRESMRASISG